MSIECWFTSLRRAIQKWESIPTVLNAGLLILPTQEVSEGLDAQGDSLDFFVFFRPAFRVIMMRILCVALAIFLFSGLQQLDSKAKSSGQGRPQSDQSGSQESPIVVKVLPSTKTEQEISQETEGP